MTDQFSTTENATDEAKEAEAAKVAADALAQVAPSPLQAGDSSPEAKAEEAQDAKDAAADEKD